MCYGSALEIRKTQISDQHFEKLKTCSYFELKIIPFTACTVIALFDEGTVKIDTSASKSFEKSPAIWSNNSYLVELAKIYFEKSERIQPH